MGAASACKWTGVFVLAYVFVFFILHSKWSRDPKTILINILKLYKHIILYIAAGFVVYALSFSFVFWHYGFDKIIELHQQMYWYHSHLVATHPSESPAFSWPLDLKPVWFWVNYQQDTTANIYAFGHPLIFWCGFVAVFFTLFLAIITRHKNLWYLLLAYPTAWLQWIDSPRIMFLYHYLPAVPIMCIILAFTLWFIWYHNTVLKAFVYFFLISVFVTFWYFYPFWTGIPLSKPNVEQHRWLTTWR